MSDAGEERISEYANPDERMDLSCYGKNITHQEWCQCEVIDQRLKGRLAFIKRNGGVRIAVFVQS